MKRSSKSSKPSFPAPQGDGNLSSDRPSAKTFNKKRFWTVIAIVAVIEVLAIALVQQWRYIFPSHEVSEIYTRYENTDGIDASFIKDFRVNDSVFIDVTLLEAKDSAGWALLCKDFAISDVVKVMQHIDKDIIISRQVSKDDYTQVLESYTPDAEMLAFSYVDKEISIFHTNNEKEHHAVYYHNFDESTFNN